MREIYKRILLHPIVIAVAIWMLIGGIFGRNIGFIIPIYNMFIALFGIYFSIHSYSSMECIYKVLPIRRKDMKKSISGAVSILLVVFGILNICFATSIKIMLIAGIAWLVWALIMKAIMWRVFFDEDGYIERKNYVTNMVIILILGLICELSFILNFIV